MKFATKSVLLDEDVYRSLLHGQNEKPVTAPPARAGQPNPSVEFEKILSDKSSDPDKKLANYQRAFSDHKHFVESSRKPTKGVFENQTGPIKEVTLTGSRKPAQVAPVQRDTKAQKLARILEKRLQWNAYGEVLQKNGRPIKGSNIRSIVSFLVSNKRSSSTLPQGIRKLSKILATVDPKIFGWQGKQLLTGTKRALKGGAKKQALRVRLWKRY